MSDVSSINVRLLTEHFHPSFELMENKKLHNGQWQILHCGVSQEGLFSGYFVFEPNTSLRLPLVSPTAVLVLKKTD